MAAPELRPLSTGEVLDTSFSIYRRWFVPLFTIAVITRIIPVALQHRYVDPENVAANTVAMLLIGILGMLLGAIGIGASTKVVSAAYLGGELGAVDALQASIPFIGRLVKVSILTSLMIAGGLILLIIPGIIVALGVSLAAAVMVIEQPAGARVAIRRSMALTAGHRMRILVCLAVPMVIMFFGAVGVALVLPTVSGTASTVVGTVAEVLVVPYFYVVIAVLYYDLRVRKEGFDLELLAQAA